MGIDALPVQRAAGVPPDSHSVFAWREGPTCLSRTACIRVVALLIGRARGRLLPCADRSFVLAEPPQVSAAVFID
ncbi:hypothetical protein [Caballeronia arationis]|uniref:hypothetical protein n=1 Tax=Caballeronia arationis TaxID=1777142 RepID=UPI00078800BE|nr:hypothetical protein [Caballeronia arationis]